MPIDAESIIQELQAAKKTDRTRKSVYLSETLFTEFSAACDEHKISASETLERLMAYFLDSLKRTK